MADKIVLDMFINIKAVRWAYVDGKEIRVANKNVKPYWPDQVIKLAEFVKDGGPAFALYDALLELQLPRIAGHFVEIVHDNCEEECYYADIIKRCINPDWGNSFYAMDDKDKIKHLEMQAELEEYWMRVQGIKFETPPDVKKWCDTANKSKYGEEWHVKLTPKDK